MSGLSQRRGVLGIAVIALGALLVLAVNVISGRAVDGVAAPGPPPPLPAPNSCLQLRGQQTWQPASCTAPHRATVIVSWSSTAPADQRTLKSRRCATQTLANQDGAASWPPAGVRTRTDSASPWLEPGVPWTAMTVSGGGSGGWTSCVMVAWPFGRAADTPLTDLAEFTIPAGDIVSAAQLPVSLRRCNAGEAPLVGGPAVPNDDRVPCTQPHQWEQVAAMEDPAGDPSRLPTPAEQQVIIQNYGDGLTGLSPVEVTDPGEGANTFAMPGAMPSGCYLRTKRAKFVATSLAGIGERPIPYVSGG
ncbi:hypothetical protein [Nakamurella aerolata]|uniref:Uncharacterized protein n=1 Tax=Nakamurella aerolata TaxID=1656892 RepID=A0A849A5B0_9ACTN|nr:hypothetical protein [Nakamurella aerolata]NNG34201.1 hypothetical protein [Nakamurella aerolata]